ncbi:hypothetical protein ATE84_4144 [Aquimarina sp. MAR_2010_214]|nr:hypothetical protein [Aquimarina sp. MAR_2010_214]PKV52043.1 hypothetical protein ATE84_4144 [Aquimarina sp. MAR_2010_214]
MKLQKLDFDNFEKYKLENSIRILGGGTCIHTCCTSSGEITSCEDTQDDS